MDVDPFAGTTANGEVVDTEFCVVAGEGSLESGDSFLGGVEQINAEGGLSGEIYFYGPEMENPDCAVEDDDDDDGCRWSGPGRGLGHDRHGEQHQGWSRGRGHASHGEGGGGGHGHHGHGDGDGDGDDAICEPLQDVIVLHPETLRCRVNGLTLGDIDGMATVNDLDGYFFSLSMQAFEDPLADYVSLRLWAPNPDYTPGGAEPEWVLDREIIGELSSGQIDIALP